MKTKKVAIRVVDLNGLEIDKERLRMSLISTLVVTPTTIDDGENWIIITIPEDKNLFFEIKGE